MKEIFRNKFTFLDQRDQIQDRSSTGSRSLPDHGKGHSLKAFMSKTKRSSYEEEEEGGSDSDATDSSFMIQDEVVDGNVIETFMGEWKNDKRCGFGIAERSDGIKYEGEWYNNKKFGYGRTTFKDGTEEKGKYKNNVLLTSGRKKHLFLLRSAKFRERVEAAVNGAHRASQIALQKADIAISRTATARGKAEQADELAKHARAESDVARLVAKNYAPELAQQGRQFYLFLSPHLGKKWV
ncbi:junctophilin-1 [Trichonephila inaurata madagascariensis]|uniref:Junctophilin-1 n=1 Tax=Trichonephila inaurata madagascariensis TaxID=2747483 RepID=A0A8X6XB55_9ARAC|nr:junctophilin-1 [Trichonephila inaurata madagascariensis]